VEDQGGAISLAEEVTLRRPRSKTGQAIAARWRTPEEVERVQALVREAQGANDLDTWRRAKAILGYLDGKRVAVMCEDLGVVRGSINRWLRWYNAMGVEGLRTGKPPGRQRRLTQDQRDQLIAMIDAGPPALGFSTGMWTGPMVAALIEREFGVRYHHNYVPGLLHQLGFSVQRPRKRLARADAEAQGIWLRERLPRIKKKREPAEGS
jgi:transposase